MDQKPNAAPPRMFNILLTENELTFIANAIFQVQINSADARVVSDLQKRLVDELNTVLPVPAETV